MIVRRAPSWMAVISLVLHEDEKKETACLAFYNMKKKDP